MMRVSVVKHIVGITNGIKADYCFPGCDLIHQQARWVARTHEQSLRLLIQSHGKVSRGDAPIGQYLAGVSVDDFDDPCSGNIDKDPRASILKLKGLRVTTQMYLLHDLIRRGVEGHQRSGTPGSSANPSISGTAVIAHVVAVFR